MKQLLTAFLFFLLFSLPILTLTHPTSPSNLQYDDDDDQGCQTAHGFFICHPRFCPCPILDQDIFLSEIVSVISIIFSSVLIIGYLSIKELRAQPGDFFLGFSLGEFGLGLTSLIEANYDKHHDHGLSVSDSFCDHVAISRVFLRRAVGIYYISYVIYYLMSMRYSLKASKIPHFLYHMVPWMISFMLTLYEYSVNSLGKTIRGTCDMKSTVEVKQYTIEVVLCFFGVTAALYLAKKLASRSDNLTGFTKKHLRYYLSYFVFSELALAVTTFAKFYGAQTLKDYMEAIDNADPSDDHIISRPLIAEGVVVFTDTVSPIILTIIRLYDPILRPHWKKLFYKICCCCCCHKRLRFSNDKLSESLIDDEAMDSFDFDTSLDASEINANIQKQSFLQQVQHNYRCQVVFSLLASIHYHWKILKKQAPNNLESLSSSKKAAKEMQRYKVTDQLINESLPDLLQEVHAKNFSILSGRFTVYAPEMFEQIMKSDRMDEDLINSLDLGRNYSRILKSGEAQGGRGGEFFFFSDDNRLIIKTLSTKDLKVLLGILPRYVKHFQANPKSLIAKIYAVFTYEVKNPYEKYHIILMKNVNGYPSTCTQRKYDLKGSTVDRAVLEELKGLSLQNLKQYGIMKDQDFDKYEKKLNIPLDKQNELLHILRKDVTFLRMEGLIDYSLVVYLVNRTRATRKISEAIPEESLARDSVRSSTASRGRRLRGVSVGDGVVRVADPLISIKSETEDLYYHLGIIDYLTIFDWKKRFERFYKQLKRCNSKLDTSCQDPQIYNRRFFDYMEKIIRGGPEQIDETMAEQL